MSEQDFHRIFHGFLTHGNNDPEEICELSGRTRRECGCAHNFAVFNPTRPGTSPSSSRQMNTSSPAFKQAKDKIVQAPATEEEKQTHIQIRSSLTPDQQKAVDALQKIARDKGGDFLLVDQNSPRSSSVDDFVAAFVQDWDDSDLQKERNLIHLLLLKKEDFDTAGDFRFPNENGDEQKRGGMPYYQPNSNWIRLGLRVKGKYDNGNDDWLMMNGNPREWAVAFHGSTETGTRGIAQSRTFWTSGDRQAYQNFPDVNELSDQRGQPCGRGAYFGAKIQISEDPQYAKYIPSGHKCILQVRIKPDKIRIPNAKPDFRIVNEPEYIRPYGICLKMRNENAVDPDNYARSNTRPATASMRNPYSSNPGFSRTNTLPSFQSASTNNSNNDGCKIL